MSELTSSTCRIKLYGIENCDQVRRAKTWLKDNNHVFEFHDFRKQGIAEELIKQWLTHLPWDAVINRKGLTWRKLSAEQKALLTDQTSAIAQMLSDPTVIKRPVLTFKDVSGKEHVGVGFSAEIYQSLFQ